MRSQSINLGFRENSWADCSVEGKGCRLLFGRGLAQENSSASRKAVRFVCWVIIRPFLGICEQMFTNLR